MSLVYPGGERLVTTDTEGRFDARGLEPGSYRVYGKANGYIESQYGQRLPGEGGTYVEVIGGRITADITVRLRRASVVGGRIFDESGDGFAGVEVELHRRQYLPRGVTWVPVAFGQTDALGLFRIGELQPAEYRIKAYTPGHPRPVNADGNVVYAPTYFPSTTRLEEALPLVVSAGQELLGVDFALLAVQTFDVTGIVIDPMNPTLGRAAVRYTRTDTQGLGETVQVAADGTFRIPGLVPADYVLRGIPPNLSMPAAAIPGFQVTVDDHLSGVELVVNRGARLEGRIVADGGRPLTFDPSQLRVGLEMRPGNGGIILAASMASVQSDGTFSLDGAVQPTTLAISKLPPPWAVQAVRLNGRDITHDATDFGEGVVRGLQVVLTDAPVGPTRVSGLVTDHTGDAVSNYIVVVFPENRDRWWPPAPFVHAMRPGQDGQYRIQALPPADYLAVAVESLPQFSWADVEVLAQLWPHATRFRLDDGSHVTVNLRLSRTPAGLPVVR